MCEKGSTKKRIIRKANLNWYIANKYIECLLENGFIEFDEGFILTQKGKELNERLKSLQELGSNLFVIWQHIKVKYLNHETKK